MENFVCYQKSGVSGVFCDFESLALFQNVLAYRSSHRRCSARKDVLRNSTKFTGKHLCQSLYLNNVAGWPETLLKQRLEHRCFPVNFAKVLRTPFSQNMPG